jgi:hypothetical protein
VKEACPARLNDREVVLVVSAGVRRIGVKRRWLMVGRRVFKG